MATTLLLKEEMTLIIGGKKRLGALYFDYENQQLIMKQNEIQIDRWKRLGFTPWNLTHLTDGVPNFLPGNFVEIRDFNRTAGVAEQLEIYGIGRIDSDRLMDPLLQPENPRRIKRFAIKRELINAARSADRVHTHH